LQAFDGRVRQPGLGIPRPRGVQAGEAVPAPARIGVPALPAALAAVHAAFGRTTLRRAAGPAVERARAVSPERAAVLEVFARRGAAAMGDDAVAGELAAVAGRAAGGTLTQDDLTAVRPSVVTCDERSLAPSGILRVPWRDAAPGGTATHVVAAADGWGLVAIACYEVPGDGVSIPALGLLAPPFASPVKRGETRVRPGEPCPASAPVALRTRRGIVDVAIGVAGLDPLDDHRGRTDRHGRKLASTIIAVADQLAAAAGLVMRKSAGCPVALIRGFEFQPAEGSARSLLRKPEQDLFR